MLPESQRFWATRGGSEYGILCRKDRAGDTLFKIADGEDLAAARALLPDEL